jgi:ubiquinol-cytochrome c reductase core subunit 2
LQRQLSVTTLGNGITVVTDDVLAATSTVTVSVASGSRNESAGNAGVTGILNQMSFQGTVDRSALAIQRETERDGTALSSSANKETIQYSASFLSDNLESAVFNLSDAVTGQKFDAWEVADAKADAKAVVLNGADAVVDALHAGAFRNTLGRSEVTPLYKVAGISAETLGAFTEANFTGGNISVVGAGVNHSALVELVSDNFGVGAGSDAPGAAATYYGGAETRMEADTGDVVFGFGYAGAAASAPEAAATAVLASVLGAAGGLKWGSGNSANKLAAAVSAAAPSASVASFNQSYSDAGILGVVVTAPAAEAAAAVAAAASGIASVFAGDITPEDVAKAKNKLAVSLYDTSPAADAANVAAQLLSTKSPLSAADLAEAVSAVTVADVLAAAEAAKASTPTFAAYGDVVYAPYADEL